MDVTRRRRLNQWAPARRGKGQPSAIDMFNKLALMTAGVIVSEPVGSASSYGGLQTPYIAACA